MRYNNTLVLTIATVILTACENTNPTTKYQAPSPRPEEVIKPTTTPAPESIDPAAAAKTRAQTFEKLRDAIDDLKIGKSGGREPEWCRPEDNFGRIETVRGVLEGHVISQEFPLPGDLRPIPEEEMKANKISLTEIKRLYDRFAGEYTAFLKKSLANPHPMTCGQGEGFRDFGDQFVVIIKMINLSTHPYEIPLGWSEETFRENVIPVVRKHVLIILAGKAEHGYLSDTMKYFQIKLEELNLNKSQKEKILANTDFVKQAGIN
jgi:hypothetical protein